LIGGEGDRGYLLGVSVESKVSLGVIDIPKIDVVFVSRRSDVFTKLRRSYRS
jgi:hypothetical protein